jgi:hypothetical protein
MWFHLHTVWLFAAEPVYDSLMPCCIFIFCAAVSGPVLGLPSQSIATVLKRMLQVSIWMWLLLLQFSLHNQRHPSAITEDAINKPWRPLPARRIDISQTNKLLVLVYMVSGLLNCYMGLSTVFVIFTALVLIYNDFGGGETALRSVYNAAGFSCFLFGGLRVAIGYDITLSPSAYRWVYLMICILVTTFHAQEFRDEQGDNAIGRCTLITAIGGISARLFLVVAIVFWSYFASSWLQVAWPVATGPGVLGIVVAWLAIVGSGKMDTQLDKRMYKGWTLWIVSISLLPLAKAYLE